MEKETEIQTDTDIYTLVECFSALQRKQQPVTCYNVDELGRY